MSLKTVALKFDENLNELHLMIGDETLIIEEFLKNENGIWVKDLDMHAQFQIIKKLLNNIYY